jgi:DNA-binding transcriptional ArsR family regulator
VSEERVGAIFAALADPTRRHMVEALLRDGEVTVPALTATLPMTRQAVAKHLGTLELAGLLERGSGPGREVTYRLRGEALGPAASWMGEAAASWDQRLGRLKRDLERRQAARSADRPG